MASSASFLLGKPSGKDPVMGASLQSAQLILAVYVFSEVFVQGRQDMLFGGGKIIFGKRQPISGRCFCHKEFSLF